VCPAVSLGVPRRVPGCPALVSLGGAGQSGRGMVFDGF
jgi:hypothetical protein